MHLRVCNDNGANSVSGRESCAHLFNVFRGLPSMIAWSRLPGIIVGPSFLDAGHLHKHAGMDNRARTERGPGVEVGQSHDPCR